MKLSPSQREALGLAARNEGGEVHWSTMDALFRRGLITSAYRGKVTLKGLEVARELKLIPGSPTPT
jgi:hypothetical protein